MAATFLTAVFLIVAVVLVVLHACGQSDRVHLGWLCVAFLICAVWLTPALLAAGRLITTR